MARSVALKLVGRNTPFVEEVELWAPTSKKLAHSLHYVLNYDAVAFPEFANFLIKRFSTPGQVVYDPFAGCGVIPLEAGLLDRIPFASDINPLYTRYTKAKLSPADITEVMLTLQMIDLMRPINSGLYNEYFAPFFEINTFRELVNLRKFLQQRDDRVARFIEFIALSLLHGHSAGAFSVHTFSQSAASPEEQVRLNAKRHQTPDYRSVLPRILKKTAAATRDGIPSVLRRMAALGKVFVTDVRDLDQLSSGGVDLVVTAPPIPGRAVDRSGFWLRFWFAGLSGKSFEGPPAAVSLTEWNRFMVETLNRLAQVVRSGGRVALIVSEAQVEGRIIDLSSEIRTLVEEVSPSQWSVEGLFLNRYRGGDLLQGLHSRIGERNQTRDRFIVLQRN